jgi:exodeoxyribonuclease VII small subunit
MQAAVSTLPAMQANAIEMTNKARIADSSGTSTADFEHSLAELENIVARLEQGELSLEESLQQFERGVGLTRICQNALQQAEHKIEMLMRNGNTGAGEPELAVLPFEPDQDSAES